MRPPQHGLRPRVSKCHTTGGTRSEIIQQKKKGSGWEEAPEPFVDDKKEEAIKNDTAIITDSAAEHSRKRALEG